MGVTLRCRYDLEIEIDRFTNARNDVNKVGALSCMPLSFLLYTIQRPALEAARAGPAEVQLC